MVSYQGNCLEIMIDNLLLLIETVERCFEDPFRISYLVTDMLIDTGMIRQLYEVCFDFYYIWFHWFKFAYTVQFCSYTGVLKTSFPLR